MGRIFLTGDKHGNFKGLKEWCESNNTTKDDILVILGDAGINYYKNKRDTALKNYLESCSITLVCIHGNHEERPKNISSYKQIISDKLNAPCYIEPEYPSILFPKDGIIYLNKYRCLVLGGAYSVDKERRLLRGWNWFPEEQMNEETKQYIRELTDEVHSFDYILSHTAPLIYEPRYLFLSVIDQNTVDKSMENFLQEIHDKITFKHWYLGHYHSDDNLSDKIRLVYNDIIEIF